MLIAGGLRFAGLHVWSLWGDEAYSFVHAHRFGTSEMGASSLAYPLFFALEWLALQTLPHSLSLELVLRLVPALAGTLAAALLFRVSRGLLDRPARHLLAAMAAFSPWLLFHSQFARFYSLLLLLSLLSSFTFLDAVRTGSRRRMWQSALLFLLAMATHPTAALLLAGHLLAFVVGRFVGETRPLRLLGPLFWMLLVPLLAAAFSWRTVQETLIHRITLQDSGADSVADLIQGIVYNFGLSLSALSVAGLPLLWKRSRLLCVHVVVGAGFPFAVVFGLALLGSAVEQRYLIPVVPLMMVPAALLVAEIMEQAGQRLRGARVVVPLLVFCPFVLALASNYADGDRHDLRGAAAVIQADLRPADFVVSENHFLMQYYLRELAEDRLVEAPPRAEDYMQYAALSREGGRLWVVVPAEFADLGGERAHFYAWCWESGQLVRELYHPRLDYHQNRLQVFLFQDPEGSRWLPPRSEADRPVRPARERPERKRGG